MHIWEIQHFSKKRQQYNQIVFSAVAQEATALFISTVFYISPYHSLKYAFKRMPKTKQVCAFFLSGHRTRQSDVLIPGADVRL